MNLEDSYLFEHDKAPPHFPNIQANMDDNIRGILGPWPPNSPDLNPKENIWYLLKK